MSTDITVVLGYSNIEDKHLMVRALPLSDNTPIGIKLPSGRYVVVTEVTGDFVDAEILVALECLVDHASSTNVNDWLDYNGDYDIGEEWYAEEWIGEYHAPNMVLQVYYLA